ncbi:MAG TPA: KH domain-containing protein [Gaiellaceae bacterium]|nr:KH domain-containing protein [Gaiellaceae bacterium]
MSGSVELVQYLARRLVDEPDAVRVEEVDRDGDLVIELHVAKDDVGKVIGRQGRIARALRTVVRASAARRSGRTLLEIVE